MRRALTVPFGLKEERLWSADEVDRGTACNCVCPDPECAAPLLARQGDARVWHFSHPSNRDGGCSGGETALHQYAKQFLAGARRRVMRLPRRTEQGMYGDYDGNVRIVSGVVESPIAGTNRRCDVLLNVQVRPYKGKKKDWAFHTVPLGVEIAVFNLKDSLYVGEVATAGQLSVLEIKLNWPAVLRESERLSKQFRNTVEHILLNQSDSKRWLYRKGQPVLSETEDDIQIRGTGDERQILARLRN